MVIAKRFIVYATLEGRTIGKRAYAVTRSGR
jgi:hypothetical protein